MRAVLLLAALGLIGCRPDEAPRTRANRPAGPIAPPRPDNEDLTTVGAGYQFTADQFFAEWKADEKLAAGRYLGRVIGLTGTAGAVGRSNGKSVVVLKLEGSPHGIECVTAGARPWGRAVPGQRVTIRGVAQRGPAAGVGVGLTNCVFEDGLEFDGVPVAAAALARDHGTDAAATAKKYEGQWLVVSGEVATVEFDWAGSATAVLKTAGAVKVRCVFGASVGDLTKPLAPGQTVRAVARPTFRAGEIALTDALPLP